MSFSSSDFLPKDGIENLRCVNEVSRVGTVSIMRRGAELEGIRYIPMRATQAQERTARSTFSFAVIPSLSFASCVRAMEYSEVLWYIPEDRDC